MVALTHENIIHNMQQFDIFNMYPYVLLYRLTWLIKLRD